MTNGYSDLDRARQHVDPAWNGHKLEQELGRLEARVEAGKRGRYIAVLVVAMSGACAAAAVLTWPSASPTPDAIAAAPTAVERDLTVQPATVPNVEPGSAAEYALAVQPTQGPPGGATDEAPIAAERDARQKPRAQSTRVKVAGTAWRSLAREGRYHEAFRAMRGSEPDRGRAQVDELLLAGDAARLSGHAREAVPYYRAALNKAGKAPRAQLAAFTLGRTLLNELHDPSAAAQAFARAYKAAPRGPLAEEALAREAESFSRAGDLTRARAATERYQAAYPQGRLLNEVKRYGAVH